MVKYSYVVESPNGTRIVEADSLDAAILNVAKQHGFSSRPATQKDKQELLARQLEDATPVKRDPHSYEFQYYAVDGAHTITIDTALTGSMELIDPSSTEDNLQKAIDALDALATDTDVLLNSLPKTFLICPFLIDSKKWW